MLNKTMQKLGEERSVIREIFEYGNRRAAEIGREHVFDFSLGNPSVPSPACVREEIDRLLASMPAEVLHGYTSAAGAPDVREAVANYIKTSFGVPMTANLVYMTCGAAASLTITLNALCETGDEFIVLTPYFPEYRVFIEAAGGVCREVPTDARFHIDLAAVEEAINEHTKGILVNSPNNPTGVVYDEEELTALGRLLEEKSKERPIFLIADEPYRELTYGKQVPYPMNVYQNTVLCYSFSKSLSLAGERIGYIAVSPSCVAANDIFAAVAGAGRSLGFNYRQTMFYIVMPQAFKNVLPALGNEFISLLKETSVSGYIALQDLTKGGDIIRSRTYDAFMPLIAVALIYLVMVLVFSRLVGLLERRLRNSDH